MELILYNSLTRKKEPFVPLKPGQVSIYTCGPTVYADAHIGNLRSYLFPDVLRKTLAQLGYTVRQVVNITDVGHLTSDADEGEDKLERAAASSGETAWDIARRYTGRFLQDIARLNIAPPDELPTATGHIAEQIALIQTLEAKGYTYLTGDGVYFDTSRFAGYGRLARLKVEGMEGGIRVSLGEKRHKTDFALWKFSPPGVSRQMEWESPWGKGFPGWHVECSAMSMKYLGETLDIHTGGRDHIPVHHTNEIAQSEAATGHPFVRYWLHGEFLVLGSEAESGEATRMGKSEGNFLRLQTLIDQGHHPLSYRYLLLNSHYRKYLHFSWEALTAAGHALLGLRRLALENAPADGAAPPAPQGGPESWPQPLKELLADLCDDLNCPKALATLWTALKNPALSAADKWALVGLADSLLGLELANGALLPAAQEAPDEAHRLAQQRLLARQNKDWAEADRLRDQLTALGWAVLDHRDGYTLEKL